MLSFHVKIKILILIGENVKIKMVIFDLDNTLIDFYQNEQDAINHVFLNMDLKITKDIIKLFSNIDSQLWTHGKYRDYKVSKNDIPIRRFEILFKELNLKINSYEKANELFMEGLIKNVYEMPFANEIINYLSSKGYIITIATNGLVKLQYPRLKNTSFSNQINQIIASEEVGVNKPDPTIFNKLLNDNRLDAVESIMVGDSLRNDIQSAQSNGIKTIWYNPNKITNNSRIHPDYEINNLLEIKNIL